MFLKILTVAALATFELYVAIPTGFAFRLSPWIIFFASAFGGITGAFVACFLGDKIRALFYKNKKGEQKKEDKHPMLKRIWNKFGIVGLGVLGSFLVGAPISIAIGVGLNAELKKLLTWCCVGVLARCVIFTLIGHYGLKLF